MANLYNFMDGIDGIAGVETLVLGLVTGLWFGSAGDAALAIFCLGLAGAALGFLLWNWDPARIFMGDVGSVSLGACFALLALIGSIQYELPFIAFLILYGVFLADASLTLLRRLWRREKWWQAHRSHYYQRAVQSGLSHAQVSSAVLLVNLLLAGVASLHVYRHISGWLALLLASLILAAAVFLIHSRDTSGSTVDR
jgi:Fuc2NAc and GlcNAc transferase